MALVRPFRGLRYASSVADDLGILIAPPYDAISPVEEQRLLAAHESNIVRVELGLPDLTQRYEVAAATLRGWREAGVLVRDDVPSFYVTRTRFTLDGQPRERLGLTARVQLRPLDAPAEPGIGPVLRHEKTLSGPKLDRLHMLRATHTNTSSVFGLVEDGDEALLAALNAATAGAATARARTADAEHLLWIVDDPTACETLAEILRPRAILIADGHHRYETALTFAQESGAHGEHPMNHAMMYLARMEDPGLACLGYHRAVRNLPAFEPQVFVASLLRDFALTRLGDVEDAAAREAALRTHTATSRTRARFLCAVGGAGLYLLESRNGREEAPSMREALDTRVLEREIFGAELGLDDEAIRAGGFVTFHHDPAETLALVARGDAQLGFVLHAVEVHTIARIAEAGDVMPQKSTWFTPKVPTGLVLHPLEA